MYRLYLIVLIGALAHPGLHAQSLSSTSAKGDGSSDSDKEWVDLMDLTKKQPSVDLSSTLGKGGLQTPSGVQSDIGTTYRQIVDKAHDFYTKNPNSPKAYEAKKLEVISALQGAQAGDMSLVDLGNKLGTVFRSVGNYPIKDRLDVSLMMRTQELSKETQGKTIAQVKVMQENILTAVHQEFGDVDEVFHLYRSAMLTMDQASSLRLAKAVIGMQASAKFKDSAKEILDRDALRGKSLAIDLRDLQGNRIDLASSDGKFTVLYFWSLAWNIGSPDRLPSSALRLQDKVRWVFVSLATSPAALTGAEMKPSIPGAMCAIFGGFNSPTAEALKLHQCPYIYVLNDNGKVMGYGRIEDLSGILNDGQN
jgi:hypothetical protein